MGIFARKRENGAGAAVQLREGGRHPFGVLDGARSIQNLLPARFCVPLARAQRTLLAAFCLLAPLLTFVLPVPGAARMAAFLAPAYLLAQESGI